MRLHTSLPLGGHTRSPVRPGYVIIAVLIVVVVLSLAAYQFTELMTAEYRAAVRTSDATQARLAAVSGVHYAAAMLADPNSYFGDLGGNPFADGAFDTQPVREGPTPRQTPRFVFVAVVPTGPGACEQRFGAVTDEGGKLNVNTLIQLDPSGELLYGALMLLPNMTADVADAIVDWVDADDDPRPTGAESSTYQGFAKPYRAKNGPLNSVDELLLVKGVTPQLLYGTDRNLNGVADDGGNTDQLRGWADFLTVYGRELNVDTTGALRVNVNDSEDLPGLHQRLTDQVGSELADYIVAYKLFTVSTVSSGASGSGSNSNSNSIGGSQDLNAAVQAALPTGTDRKQIKSLLDLQNTQVTLPKAADAPQDAPTVVVPSPLNDPAKFNSLIGLLMDKTTATAVVEMTPRLNVNTAPREVLMTLTSLAGGAAASPGGSGTATGTPGTLAEADIDNIIAQRDAQDPTSPDTLTGAWLMTVGGMNPATFKAIEKYVTGRTMVFRVQSIGYFAQGGPVARVEAVVDTNQGAPRVLYFRDLSDLPQGFDLPQQ
jgi:hypothetical protein